MDNIVDKIINKKPTSELFGAYLEKLDTTISDAYSAGEQGQDYVAMMKVGEAKNILDHVVSLWKEMQSPTGPKTV